MQLLISQISIHRVCSQSCLLSLVILSMHRVLLHLKMFIAFALF